MRFSSFFLLFTIHISSITCADQNKPLLEKQCTIAKIAWDPKKKSYTLQLSLREAVKHSYKRHDTKYLSTYLDERLLC